MAFTLAQIEKALSAESELLNYHFDTEQINRSPNYATIVDYLTGKTNVLPALQQDYNTFIWAQLINLLNDLEKPSANDQLVLNVIRHPDLVQALEYHFHYWLIQYARTHTSKSATQAVISQFKATGMSDDDIFGFFILQFGFNHYPDFNIERTGLKEYFIDYIRRSKQLIYPRSGYLQWSDDWSMLYFELLEEAKPEFAFEYALYGIYSERNNPVLFLHDHKKGYYLPHILSFIQDKQNASLRIIQSKFSTALILYEAFPGKYRDVAVELSLQYIEYLNAQQLSEKWESSVHLNEFSETDLSYLPYTSCAFHILLKHERDKALLILKDFFSGRKFIQQRTLLVLLHHLGKNAFPYLEMAMGIDGGGIDYYRSLTELLQQEFDKDQYLPLIWKLAGNKSRQLRELVAKVVAEHDAGAESRAIELLNHKSADIRQTAALILTQFSSPAANEAISGTLNKETSDNARDILLQSVAGTLPVKADENFINEMVEAAQQRGKLTKPVEPWLEETSLPPLFDHSGRQISNERVRFLLYRMSRVKEMRSDIEARYIIQTIDKEKAGDFAMELIKLYMDKNAKPGYKWLMALAALLGDDSVVDKIRVTINRWMDENRYKMAEHGVGALALQGSDKALRWVEWYSRKYKSKKANVGAAALVALETAAEELGITIHELGDRVVPDFGFDGLFKHFTVDGDEYRAFIDSNFKIAFFNENNKKLKTIPAAASAELKDEFKTIAKEVRDIVRSQSSRLEYYLIVQRRWNYEQWQKFFLQNPVMFIYATKLLWGVYDERGNLADTFLCDEDTSLVNMDGDEISPAPNALIGIVHPSQLDEASLRSWKKQFFDLSIESIFPQLERKLPDLKDLDLSKSIIIKYKEKHMVTGSIRSVLERYGWHKGPTGDGGMLDSFNLLYADGVMEAILEVEGVGAGYGWGGDEKLGRVYIIDKSKIKERWFNPPQNDSDDRLIKLKNVPPIFLSEMLAAIESVKEVNKTGN
jgi:hypothetical protein